MNKKSNVKKTAALLLGLTLALGGVGCGNFIVTDNEKDLAQTVATVNIAASLKDSGEYTAEEATEVASVLGKLTTDIKKRDLVAYFLSTGYQYVESYGYSYKDTFNMLMDGLVSREIMIQYAIAYYLKKNENLTGAACDAYVEEQKKDASLEKEQKALYEAHPEVLTLKYFLTDGGVNNEDYDRAVYSLKKSINDSLDSLELNYIKAETEEHDHSDARTLPTSANTEKEDYYDTNYDVYTGRNTVTDCAPYEKQEGSTTSTRQKAYNAFLANLQGYNLISTSGALEDTSVVTNLDYYYVELSSMLGQSLINKYFESLEEEAAKELDPKTDGVDSYAKRKYDELYEAQKRTYSSDPTAFATAMDSVSDSNLLLYGLKDFGYVYNILIPFSTTQEIEYTRAKNNAANNPNSKQDDLYNVRKEILKGVKAKDLRGSWISEHDHADYSKVALDGQRYFFADQLDYETRKALFGEDVPETTKYESLKQYAGTYAYNGTYVDGEATATPVSIESFIKDIFEPHINKVVGSNVASGDYVNSKYEPENASAKYTQDDGKVDYEKFTYYQGKVNLTAGAKDYFNPESDLYKAISAVTELTFAYSTDPGCLNQYFGYAVSPYKTNFVKEFEWAAQAVIKLGVGNYMVCATDYGWHVIFASFVYDTEKVYGEYSDVEAQTEGTFSNIFRESLKTTVAKNHTTAVQNNVLNRYDNAKSVTRYEKRYKDLLELDA